MITERMQTLAGINESTIADYTELEKQVKSLGGFFETFGILISDEYGDDLPINAVDTSIADEWSVYDGKKWINARFPKKGLTFEVVLKTIEKKKIDFDFKGILGNLKLPKDVEYLFQNRLFVPATYGFTNWQSAFSTTEEIREKSKPLLAFLDRNKIKYDTEFSQANFTFRVKVSKSKDNITKLMKLAK
jgi:hypothetical protein